MVVTTIAILKASLSEILAGVKAGAGAVYSEDLQHGRTYRGVTVQDPFAA